MSKDFFNIEDILNNKDNKGNKGRTRVNFDRNNGPSIANLPKNSSEYSKNQYNPARRKYPNFNLEKSKTQNFDMKKSNNAKFNNFDLKELKGNKFDSNNSVNRKNSKNADIYYMDQDTSNEFISAIEDNKKQYYDLKPRKGRKLYGEDMYSSKELEKAPELVKVTPRIEEKAKNKKLLINRRSNLLIFSVVVILIFFLVLIFLLLNQSRVMEVSYENAGIKSQIAQLEKDNAERSERLSREADLNEIAKRASKYGFQIPNRQQKIEVKDDKLDQVVYFDENNNAIGIASSEVDLDLVIANIEKYILEKEESIANFEKQEKNAEKTQKNAEKTENNASDQSDSGIDAKAKTNSEGETGGEENAE